MSRIGGVFLLALILSARPASPAPAPPDTSALGRAFTPEQLRQDLHVLRATFEGAHAGLYRYSPKATMDSAFDDVEHRLTRPLTGLDFYRRLAPLIDLIHDSHTPLATSAAIRREFRQRRLVFPLNLRYVGERPFVERNVGPNREIPIRGEVLAVNGRPMSDVTRQVLVGRGTDGWIRRPKFHAMDQNFWFHYAQLVDTSQTFRVEIRDPASGQARVYTTSGAPADSVLAGRYTTRRHDEFTLDLLDSNRVALMSIPTLADTALYGKFRDAFAEIARRRIHDLVIDLRDNPGGLDEFNTELLGYLVHQPYHFYRGFTFVARDTMAIQATEHEPRDFIGDEDVRRKTPEQWAQMVRDRPLPELIERVNATNLAAGVHEPVAKPFDGRLYVLVNGGSASSGAEVPALLHHLGIGTLIGEEPNGSYQGVTAGILLRLVLPNTQLSTRVSMIAYHNAVLSGVLEGRGAPPDFEVPESLEDAILGQDTALNFALGRIRTARP